MGTADLIQPGSSTDHAAIASRLFEHSVRFAGIIWLAAEDNTIPSDQLESLLEDNDNKELESIFGPLPEYVLDEFEGGSGARDAWEFLSDHLQTNNQYSFLINAETPVRVHKDGRVTVSWGCYRTKWFYCESLEEGAEKAILWTNEMAEKDRDSNMERATS